MKNLSENEYLKLKRNYARNTTVKMVHLCVCHTFVPAHVCATVLGGVVNDAVLMQTLISIATVAGYSLIVIHHLPATCSQG